MVKFSTSALSFALLALLLTGAATAQEVQTGPGPDTEEGPKFIRQLKMPAELQAAQAAAGAPGSGRYLFLSGYGNVATDDVYPGSFRDRSRLYKLDLNTGDLWPVGVVRFPRPSGLAFGPARPLSSPSPHPHLTHFPPPIS